MGTTNNIAYTQSNPDAQSQLAQQAAMQAQMLASPTNNAASPVGTSYPQGGVSPQVLAAIMSNMGAGGQVDPMTQASLSNGQGPTNANASLLNGMNGNTSSPLQPAMMQQVSPYDPSAISTSGMSPQIMQMYGLGGLSNG